LSKNDLIEFSPAEEMMKNFLAGIVVTLFVFPLAAWLYLILGYADLRSNVPSSWLEKQVATSALDASVARHAPPQQNPAAPTEATLLDGARLYRDKCADCHGRPDNPTSDYGASFNPKAPQFMEGRPGLPENQDFYLIKYGVRRSAMPAWGNIMADSEIWQVVTLLRHLENLPPSVREELHRPAGSNP
jgi:mono/diheme cytochrome c family protein